MTLQKFKEEIENYRDKLLSSLDEKISELELELETKIFKFTKRLEKLEINKFGYSLSADDNGKNN